MKKLRISFIKNFQVFFIKEFILEKYLSVLSVILQPRVAHWLVCLLSNERVEQVALSDVSARSALASAKWVALLCFSTGVQWLDTTYCFFLHCNTACERCIFCHSAHILIMPPACTALLVLLYKHLLGRVSACFCQRESGFQKCSLGFENLVHSFNKKLFHFTMPFWASSKLYRFTRVMFSIWSFGWVLKPRFKTSQSKGKGRIIRQRRLCWQGYEMDLWFDW